MKVLGVSGEEQKALWLILGAIYHLGAAGATKGRKTRRPARRCDSPTPRQSREFVAERFQWVFFSRY